MILQKIWLKMLFVFKTVLTLGIHTQKNRTSRIIQRKLQRNTSEKESKSEKGTFYFNSYIYEFIKWHVIVNIFCEKTPLLLGHASHAKFEHGQALTYFDFRRK